MKEIYSERHLKAINEVFAKFLGAKLLNELSQ